MEKKFNVTGLCIPEKHLNDRNHNPVKVMRIIAVILFFIYLSYLIYLTFFSRHYGRGFVNVYRSINLVPFKTIVQYATANYNRNIIVTNLLGNILAFMPMGFLLPLIWKKLSGFLHVLVSAAAVSILIEAFQYISGAGSADIDDVILNTVGGFLGYGLYYCLKKGADFRPNN